MKNLVIAALIGIAIVSCNHSDSSAEATKPESEMMVAEKKFSKDSVDNKKDFVCTMPVTAGIADTCHYEGKVYGFCSEECKAEFLSDPKKYLAEIR